MIENVPAAVCNRCGMRYYDAAVVKSMERIIKKSRSAKRKIAVAVAKFEHVA